jgi:uncharacterized membrane protein YfcA
VAELLAAGLVTGFLAGLLGVGGGMMMVPFMTLILAQRGVARPAGGEDGHRHVDGHHPVHVAVQRARPPRRGAVRWDLVRSLAPGIVARRPAGRRGAFAVLKGQGAGAVLCPLHRLHRPLQMLRDRKPRPAADARPLGGQTAGGRGIGLVSGLVGAGGAFMSVPFMTWCNVPSRHAVGTSAALGFPDRAGQHRWAT